MATGATHNLLLYLFWISVSFFSGSLQLCIEKEMKALLSVRRGFPDVYRRLSPWKGDDCCSWAGVGCHNVTGHVIKLDLSILQSETVFNRSEVHPSLFHLKHLKYLDISGNNLSGHQIPGSIVSLTQLQHLDLSGCGFKGEIPYQLGNLYNIQGLFLGFNRLEGVIPKSIGNLSKMSSLDLSLNRIVGGLPETIGNLTAMQNLELVSNQISGKIPDSIGNLHQLEFLDISGNNISGSIPVPASLGKLSALQWLGLDSNHLVGDITEAHFANLTNLYSMDISDNNLSVKVSQDWLLPFQAEAIIMGSCNLGPRFPPWLRNQTILNNLDISNNGISDAFPDWFWSLCLPEMWLNVSHNHMRGMLPRSLECFKNVRSFDVSYNNFEGFIPRMQLSYAYLDFSHNSFFGPIPKSMFGELRISYLILLNNKLNGSIPSSICTQRELRIVNLANNDLSGTLPDCWGNASELGIIDVSNNKLSDGIPRTFGLLARLQSLHMNNNSLSGTIPSTLQHCKQLVVMDLSWNKLSGAIPSWFGSRLSTLRVLSLRSNNFTGAIPPQLSLIPSLQVLNLAHNNLFGSLPPSFGMFSSMMASQNKKESAPLYDAPLYGGSIYYMESVILNAKDSELPFTTSVLLVVTSIDLSNNNLSSSIPREITNLQGLRFLNLSSNHFLGNIPNEIGLMGQLESLDLSENQLSGRIPSSISNLNFLGTLNLSYNNLIGKIPTGTQLQSFTNLSYIGNSQLCGEPLQTKCPSDNLTIDSRGTNEEEGMHKDDDEHGGIWYFIGFAPGFVFGFWGFIGAVMIKRSTRIKYILIIDRICIRPRLLQWIKVFHLTLMMSLKEAFMNYGEVVDGKVEGLEGFGFVIFISSKEASAIISDMDGKMTRVNLEPQPEMGQICFKENATITGLGPFAYRPLAYFARLVACSPNHLVFARLTARSLGRLLASLAAHLVYDSPVRSLSPLGRSLHPLGLLRHSVCNLASLLTQSGTLSCSASLLCQVECSAYSDSLPDRSLYCSSHLVFYCEIALPNQTLLVGLTTRSTSQTGLPFNLSARSAIRPLCNLGSALGRKPTIAGSLGLSVEVIWTNKLNLIQCSLNSVNSPISPTSDCFVQQS
ncbi:hypothetical protein ZIOFF_050979 [Zingiber officinale]|uniref:RRM domain-containing protein n=1 Tax=Zingiber officinale TaxID=94328 RepID=A0A8J5FL34_ZINOF|nr:hypothetical protein ZIOFF_050979 [Zingiber officinale]